MNDEDELPNLDGEPAAPASRRGSLKWWAFLAFGAVGFPELVHLLGGH